MSTAKTMADVSAPLDLSDTNLRSLEPIIVADFMRAPLGQHQATVGMHNRTTQSLLDWLYPALQQTFAAPPTAAVWDDDDPTGLPVAQIYKEYDVDPAPAGWIKLYRAEPTAGVLDLLRPYFEGRFVIGFELSPFQRAIFSALAVPYVSLAIHPLRFMQDYCFMVSSNIGDLQALQPFAFTREQIAFAAQLRRAEFLNKTPPNIDDGAAVLFGQVEIDAALIGGRGMISLQDHFEQVTEFCERFETVYFKPHPYGANNGDQTRFFAQFENVKFCTGNPYALLAAPQVRTVAALTSSILTEAAFFGKDTLALSDIWQDRTNEPAYGIGVLSAEFWKVLLNSANDQPGLIVPPPAQLTDVTIKSLLNVSWETHGKKQVSESGIDVVLDTKMKFGQGGDADGMRRGGGWKTPANDHCWAGARDTFLSFRLPPQLKSDLNAKITLVAMATEQHPISLQIVCQEQVLMEKVLTSAGPITLDVPLMKRLTSAVGDVLLEFMCSQSHSQFFINGGPDRRNLSIALHTLEIESPKNAMSIHVGQTLHARDAKGNVRFMPYGWYEPEDDGVWTQGSRSCLQIAMHPIPEEDLELKLGNVRAFLSDLVPVNALFFLLNGKRYLVHKFERGQLGDMTVGGVELSLPLPRELFCNDDGIAIINLEIVACHSPVMAGLSSDTRDLGLKIGHFSFHSVIQSIAAKPSKHIANIFGPFNIHTGLAVMARNSFLAIESAMGDPAPDMKPLPKGLEGPRAVNFNNSNHFDKDTGLVQPDASSSDINIFSGDVTRVANIVRRNGNAILKNRYNICYGAWELETLPTYLADTRYIDEYWGLSTFIADAAKKRMDVPVHAFPIPVDLHFPDVVTPRQHFGIPRDAFAFLFTFSVDSTMARKNPEAVLDAFQVAFPNPETPVVLVFKSMIRQASSLNLAAFAAFRTRAEQDPRVVMIEETLNRDENASLYLNSDAYISLHRAEGFGLTMAEAMGYGKPTIGTGYSGNLDFMNNDNSCLVKFAKVEMDPLLYHGQQQEWAEPDVNDAAGWMQRVFEDIHFREKIARAGKKTIYEEFSNHSVGKKLLSRLQKIHEERS